MGKIISAYIVPHPPIIIPEVGNGRELEAENTINGMLKVAASIKEDKPSTIIVISPHAPVFQDYIYISTSQKLNGDMVNFGCRYVNMSFRNNVSLVDRIIDFANTENIKAGGLDESIYKRFKVSKKLDHGTLVPLYYIKKQYPNFDLVHISIAQLSKHDLYKFGMCIGKAIEDTDENVVLIASGDLSHRLTQDAPYGFNPRGKEFDDLIIAAVTTSNINNLLEIDEELCESAGECGLRSFIIMYGAIYGHVLNAEKYSYEGPFGVGYLVSKINILHKSSSKEYLKSEVKETQKIKYIKSFEDPYISLARESLEAYVKDNKIISIDSNLPEEMLINKAGVFVSIKKHGELRGCIGTISPTRKNIAEEIIYNAISSGVQDNRFEKVRPNELDSLVYSVDILMEPEPIYSIDELDVKEYGVIVSSGLRRGLLLPNLEGIDTKELQIRIALQKGGINKNERYNMEKFKVIRHK